MLKFSLLFVKSSKENDYCIFLEGLDPTKKIKPLYFEGVVALFFTFYIIIIFFFIIKG